MSDDPDSNDMTETNGTPRVSCLMVTADRPALCRRAVRCYTRQSYPNKELVVIDDGAADLGPILADVPADELTYVKLPKDPAHVLGHLRNLALDKASAEYVAQWDDDDWYHPLRVERQMAALLNGADACSLSGTLVHLETADYFEHPYMGFLQEGVPGSIVHRNDGKIRYPEVGRGEDTAFLQHWHQRSYAMLPRNDVHLYIRCFHGSNTWEIDHFLRRLRNNVPGMLAYLWHEKIRGKPFDHPGFRLDSDARATFEMYLEDSYEFGIFPRT